MFALKSIVIARQLEELRAESAARRLARTLRPGEDEAPRGRPSWQSRLDDPAIAVPVLRQYPYPIR
jgi:hypothetical protein